MAKNKVRRWEYMATSTWGMSDGGVASANALGAIGWELVSVMPDPRNAFTQVLYFKREVT